MTVPLDEVPRNLREHDSWGCGRFLAREVLAEQKQIPPGRLTEIDLSEYRLEPTERKGVRIEKPGGHKRFSYQVTGPEALDTWLRGEPGKDLLTSRDTDGAGRASSQRR